MDEVELKDVRERADKATRGPWENAVACVYVGRPALMIADAQQCVNFDNNTEFIAHARTDVPNLLDEIERLRCSLEYIQRNRMLVGEAAYIVARNALGNAGKSYAEIYKGQEEPTVALIRERRRALDGDNS